MFCVHCGSEIVATARFCPVCGRSIEVPSLRRDPSSHRSGTKGLGSQVSSRDSGTVALPGITPTDELTWQSGEPSVPSSTHYLWALLGIAGGIIGWAIIGDRDRRLGRRVLFAGVAVSVLALALSVSLTLALTSDTSHVATSSSTFGVAPAASPTSSVPTSTVSAGGLTRSWTFAGTSPGGYAMSGTFRIGKPQKPRPGLTIGDATLPSTMTGDEDSTCEAGSVTEAVIPAELTVTNTSSNLDATVGVSLANMSTADLDGFTSELQWEGEYAGSLQCDTDTPGDVNIVSDDPIEPHTSVTAFGFIVVGNYYTLDRPQGNVTILQYAAFGIESRQDEAPATGNSSEEINYSVADVRGPGVSRTPDIWIFTLAGTRLPVPAPNAGDTTTTVPPGTSPPVS